MGGGLRQAQGHRGKAHAGQPVPLREVVAPRPEDRAVEEGLGPPPGQGRAEGAGVGRRRGRSGEGARGLRRRRGGAPDLAWSPAADMREGRRPPRGRRAVRGARPTVARVRVVPARGAGQGSREGVLIHARVARRRRLSLPIDGRGTLPAPGAPTSAMTPRRASARGPTSHARSRSATTGRLPPTTSAAPVAPPTRGPSPASSPRPASPAPTASPSPTRASRPRGTSRCSASWASPASCRRGGNGFRGAGSRQGPPAGTTPSRTTGAGPAA